MPACPTTPLLYAHRGAPLEEPENTLPSFRRALALGAGALETDLHMTSDGHIVTSHDPDGARLAGVGEEIRRSTLAEVQRWDIGKNFAARSGERFAGRSYRVPTLEELLVELPGVPINVDVKQRDPPMVEPLLRLLRRLNAEERVLVASFHGGTLAEVRRRGYPGLTSLGQRDVLRLLLTPAPLLRLLPRHGDAAQVPASLRGISLGRRWLIERCHAANLRVDYWTVDDPTEARRLLALGADGIMTDDVAAIAPLFQELFPRQEITPSFPPRAG
ncbi:MAG: glycerophosphodiester phosphodiesterase [Myxococcales bacterium]|nr:glycerophosphodiester phosphodiesterase [Myxococcales bacterium]